MKNKNQQIIYLFLTRIILYLGVISIVIGLVRWLKILSIWLADKYLYNIPLIGDIFRSVEIIDLANIVLFAILGMAFGLASILLPRKLSARQVFILVRYTRILAVLALSVISFYSIPLIGDILRSVEIIDLVNIVFAILGMTFGSACILPMKLRGKISAILLIPIVAIIFNITSVIRYRQWVEAVGVQEKLSHAEATGLTNAFLTSQVGKKGFWGFYFYTAEYPMLPKNKIEMREMKRIDEKLKLGLIKILGEKNQIWVKIMFVLAGWMIKLFYLTISIMATISHYKYGTQSSEMLHMQADKMMGKLNQPGRKSVS